MFIAPMKTRNDASDPATAAFRFWISFWPVAPFFGVKWRFEEVMVPLQGNLAARPAGMARAGAEVQKRAAEEVAKAPAVAAPVAEKAAETAAAAPAQAREAAIEDTMERNASAEPALDLETTAKKPKGLLAKAPESPDDLKLIKGVGPSIERQLNDLGIYTFRQIAKMGEADLTWIDARLEPATFRGRCFRDDWVGQAKAQAN